MTMANAHRGDVSLTIGGEPLTLRLTLQGLAELEGAFGATDLSALGDRFATGRLATHEIIRILGIALRGGGHVISDTEVANRIPASELKLVLAAIAELLLATFGASTPNP